jgi:head-tail adaptor
MQSRRSTRQKEEEMRSATEIATDGIRVRVNGERELNPPFHRVISDEEIAWAIEAQPDNVGEVMALLRMR